MKETRIVCDITGEPNALTLKRYTGKTEFNGVENEHEHQEFDINPELLVKRLNTYFCKNYTEEKAELWKHLTRKK